MFFAIIGHLYFIFICVPVITYCDDNLKNHHYVNVNQHFKVSTLGVFFLHYKLLKMVVIIIYPTIMIHYFLTNHTNFYKIFFLDISSKMVKTYQSYHLLIRFFMSKKS